jgi:hypothetical protein
MFNPAAVMSWVIDPLTDAEMAEFEQQQTRVPELEDLERLKAAIAQPNPEAVKAIERLEIRRGRVLMGYPPGGRRPPPCPSADRRPSPAT